MMYTEATRKSYTSVAQRILDQLNIIAQNCTHSEQIKGAVSTINVETGREGVQLRLSNNRKINVSVIHLDTKSDTYNIQFIKVNYNTGMHKEVANYEMIVDLCDFFYLLNKS